MGKTIREMSEEDAGDEELFPLGSLDGDEATLGQLIKKNHTVEITASMGTAEVPMRGGLLDPNENHMLLVKIEPGKIDTVPQRDGDPVNGKTITGWKLRQNLRPTYVERLRPDVAAMEASFAALLLADETAAASLLDRMQDRAEKQLGVTA